MAESGRGPERYRAKHLKPVSQRIQFNDLISDHATPVGFPEASLTIAPPSTWSGRGEISSRTFELTQIAWPSFPCKTTRRVRTMGSLSRSAYKFDQFRHKAQGNETPTAEGNSWPGHFVWSHPHPSTNFKGSLWISSSASIYARTAATAAVSDTS